MSGWLTPGFSQLSTFTGSEQFNIDTELSGGVAPQSAMMTLANLAIINKWLAKELDKTPVSGTRYYTGVTLGNSVLLTGIEVLVGSTGGTDSWIFELHDSTGALVATTTTSGPAMTSQTWPCLHQGLGVEDLSVFCGFILGTLKIWTRHWRGTRNTDFSLTFAPVSTARMSKCKGYEPSGKLP